MSDKTRTLTEELWTADVTVDTYGPYHEHIFEQYRMIVQSAETNSAQRAQANSFFLTLNTFFLTGVGAIFQQDIELNNIFAIFAPLAGLLVLCYVWWRLLRAYRQLNSAKFKVIGEYEKQLPSSPYVRAEWQALGRGKDPKLYTPLSKLENWVPPTFGFIYLIAALILLIL